MVSAALTCASLTFVLFIPCRGGQEKEIAHSFRMEVVSEITTTLGQGKFKATMELRRDYTIRQKEHEASIIVDAIDERASLDGKESVNRHLTKDRIISRVKGKVESDVSIDKASAEDKELLALLFRVPLCKYEVDAAGNETKSPATDRTNAKPNQEPGVISEFRLFHAPFLDGKAKWQRSIEMPMPDEGEWYRGEMLYEKVDAATDSDKARVKVRGTLINKLVKRPNDSSVRDSRLELKGEQIYDRKQKKWIEGSLEVEVSSGFYVKDDLISNTTGHMSWKLLSIPAK
jgi:hypothetical protein